MSRNFKDYPLAHHRRRRIADSDDPHHLHLFPRKRRHDSFDDRTTSLRLRNISAGSVKSSKSGFNDLLSSTDSSKHDYDRLLTPPETPHSAEGNEFQNSVTAPRRSSAARSVSASKPSRASEKEESVSSGKRSRASAEDDMDSNSTSETRTSMNDHQHFDRPEGIKSAKRKGKQKASTTSDEHYEALRELEKEAFEHMKQMTELKKLRETRKLQKQKDYVKVKKMDVLMGLMADKELTPSGMTLKDKLIKELLTMD